jgi:type IV pilus assembly protein PilE
MKHLSRGFTLIELMITVAIVAILAAVALPAYTDYVLRGRISGATQVLSDYKVKMEQYYSANRSYGSTTAAGAPCNLIDDAPFETAPGFTFSCTVSNGGQSFTLAAISGGTYEYSIDELGVRRTVGHAGAFSASNQNCWIMKRGGSC